MNQIKKTNSAEKTTLSNSNNSINTGITFRTLDFKINNIHKRLSSSSTFMDIDIEVDELNENKFLLEKKTNIENHNQIYKNNHYFSNESIPSGQNFLTDQIYTNGSFLASSSASVSSSSSSSSSFSSISLSNMSTSFSQSMSFTFNNHNKNDIILKENKEDFTNYNDESDDEAIYEILWNLCKND